MEWIQWEFQLRVLLAGVCGAVIGYERKSRMKEAGVRTHFVVAIGASLMMVVSKYGFEDLGNWQNVSLDPSRVAAQVVSGVGFLGAGMIFTQRNMIKGLTTAAGIWTTAGIGLGIGAGLYAVGVGCTIMLVLAQSLMHSRIYRKTIPSTHRLEMQVRNEPGAIESVLQMLKENRVRVSGFRTERSKEDRDLITVNAGVKLAGGAEGVEELLPFIQQLGAVESVEAK
ncbi:MgtC/SapB family protein [Paenibacillus sp. JX-17]|uniref:MgtC/SapB family protein n=1 Tax=Paenibacillus lacisoli TaxID=3064525 RepID=A0ABT9CCY1_9BACL|nr:MgtC/SapB family protein [Paenibacillus sp. JX-17]MDO7907129.1 MgtC/SapB family protein [Paenibacillus sp. JX-17]